MTGMLGLNAIHKVLEQALTISLHQLLFTDMMQHDLELLYARFGHQNLFGRYG